MNFEGLIPVGVSNAPDVIEELAPAQCPSGVLQQDEQQLEFLWRESNLGSIGKDPVTVKIDSDAVDREKAQVPDGFGVDCLIGGCPSARLVIHHMQVLPRVGIVAVQR